MRTNRPETKPVLTTAIATLVMGWSVQAAATNFALDDNRVTLYNANSSFSKHLTVGTDGAAAPSPTIPTMAGDYGIPSFSLSLATSDIQPGEYVFEAAVEFTANNNDKYLRAFIPEVFLTVADNGAVSGEVTDTTHLTVRTESGGEYLQIELQNQASDNMVFSDDGSLHVNTSNLLDLLGAADDNSALWQRIAEDFATDDSYSYTIYLSPRNYGAQGAQIGVTGDSGFMALPTQPAHFIVDSDAHVIQGEFSTQMSGASRGPVDPLDNLITIGRSTSNAAISGGASTAGSAGFANPVELSLDEQAAVQGRIQIDSRHVGEPGALYTVARMTTDAGAAHWFMKTQDGVWRQWDQSIAGLAPLREEAALDAIETIDVYNGAFRAVGQTAQYAVFMGYISDEDGSLTYNGEPVIINVTE